MKTAFQLLSSFLILSTLIPLSSHQHWSVRIFDFAKLQFFCLQLVTLALFYQLPSSVNEQLLYGALLMCTLYNGSILVRYTPLYRVPPRESYPYKSDALTMVSANVLQFNTDYERFVELIQDAQPDIFLTMESNEDWDTAMRKLESEYPFFQKIPLENTYGMHLYSKIPMTFRTHYFVADDLPSIEAVGETAQGYRFRLFCVHPPPPSPTEEETSKERDGELLSVAKDIKEKGGTALVVGDFNNVAWSRSSVLFRKLSETVDPRMGRGFNATFHAKYPFARFPIDQIFHTPDIFVEELKTLPYFGSDHLALYLRFHINRDSEVQDELVEALEEGEMKEVEEMIEEGIEEEGDRDEVAEPD
jgi:endonuclease/exonuclease/phosphatase (EEP) superfamily protein YafD